MTIFANQGGRKHALARENVKIFKISIDFYHKIFGQSENTRTFALGIGVNPHYVGWYAVPKNVNNFIFNIHFLINYKYEQKVFKCTLVWSRHAGFNKHVRFL